VKAFATFGQLATEFFLGLQAGNFLNTAFPRFLAANDSG